MANPRILHCLSHDRGEAARLCVNLIGALGPQLDHSVVLATPSQGESLLAAVKAHVPADFPAIAGMPTPGKLHKLAQALAAYDLVLTHDYGTLNLAMAHTAFSQMIRLPPLIHHEYGFGEGVARELSWRRNWYRRIALGRASGLVVPTEHLEGLALTLWHQPIGRVRRITPGVNVEQFGAAVRPDALRGIVKREGESWIGAIATMEGNENWQVLVRALAWLPPEWHLVIAGDGPCREAIRQEAERLDMSHRVHLPGRVDDNATFMGLLDIYALASEAEGFPVLAACAMAAGLPIVAPARLELATMVGEANAPFVVDPAKAADLLPAALRELVGDVTVRVRAGQQNRSRAQSQFTQTAMVERFRRLYASALGQEIKV